MLFAIEDTQFDTEACDVLFAKNPVCAAYVQQLFSVAFDVSRAENAPDREKTATDEWHEMLEFLEARYAFPLPEYMLTMSY